MEDNNSMPRTRKRKLLSMSILIILIIITLVLILILYELHKKNLEKSETKDDTNISVTEERNNSITNMQVFINDELNDNEIQQFKEKISKLDGVASAIIYTKQDALDEMKEKLKDNQEVLAGYDGDNNIFPDSIIVQLNGQAEEKNIREIIENMKINGKNCADKINLQKY